MKKVMARVNVGGKQFRTEEIVVYTVEEAKRFLKGRDWEMGADAYSTEKRNEAIAWSATFQDGYYNNNDEWVSFTNCIFVEKERKVN